MVSFCRYFTVCISYQPPLVQPEDNLSLEFYSYIVHCQMLRGVIEFSISLVQLVKDSP